MVERAEEEDAEDSEDESDDESDEGNLDIPDDQDEDCGVFHDFFHISFCVSKVHSY